MSRVLLKEMSSNPLALKTSEFSSTSDLNPLLKAVETAEMERRLRSQSINCNNVANDGEYPVPTKSIFSIQLLFQTGVSARVQNMLLDSAAKTCIRQSQLLWLEYC
ncbi:MAG: hypothetical protein JWR26_1903 [Pedosphaera sp.]|nr:hypothetical protein [Pedosphaera sp.]